MTTKENEPYTREVKIRLTVSVIVINTETMQSFMVRFCDLEDQGMADKVDWLYDRRGILEELVLFLDEAEWQEVRLSEAP